MYETPAIGSHFSHPDGVIRMIWSWGNASTIFRDVSWIIAKVCWQHQENSLRFKWF